MALKGVGPGRADPGPVVDSLLGNGGSIHENKPATFHRASPEFVFVLPDAINFIALGDSGKVIFPNDTHFIANNPLTAFPEVLVDTLRPHDFD